MEEVGDLVPKLFEFVLMGIEVAELEEVGLVVFHAPGGLGLDLLDVFLQKGVLFLFLR